MATAGRKKTPRYTTSEDAFTKTEIDKLMAKVGSLRDKTFIQLGFMMGPRREDLAAIEISRITIHDDEDPAWAEVQYKERKKGGEYHTAVCDEPTTRLLQQYLAYLPDRTEWLFPGKKKGTHLSGRQLWNILNKYCDSAGIRRRGVHAMRATCMKRLKDAGWSDEEVARQVNDTVRTIQEHYTRPSRSEMAELARNKPLFKE